MKHFGIRIFNGALDELYINLKYNYFVSSTNKSGILKEYFFTSSQIGSN